MSLTHLYWQIILEICTMRNVNANRNMAVKQMKFFIRMMLVLSIMIVQTGGVFAVSALQTPSLTGAVQSITLETYSATGMTVVIVTVMDSNEVIHTVRLDEKTAMDLGVVLFDSDGKLIINESALGQPVEINPEMILPDSGEDGHSFGSALAILFQRLLDWITSPW
jgi:hypothetical protein